MVEKVRRLSNQPNWSHLKIHPKSTGIFETSQRLDCILVLRHRLLGSLGRVSCWSPLGVPPRVVHVLNLYFNSSHYHIRVWFLLRTYISLNSIVVHLFVRPHLVINAVLIVFILFLLVFLIALAGISTQSSYHTSRKIGPRFLLGFGRDVRVGAMTELACVVSWSWPDVCDGGFLGESLGDGDAHGRSFPYWGNRSP
jgi:hypothetical protein